MESMPVNNQLVVAENERKTSKKNTWGLETHVSSPRINIGYHPHGGGVSDAVEVVVKAVVVVVVAVIIGLEVVMLVLVVVVVVAVVAIIVVSKVVVVDTKSVIVTPRPSSSSPLKGLNGLLSVTIQVVASSVMSLSRW
jgi:hypothetical protein